MKAIPWLAAVAIGVAGFSALDSYQLQLTLRDSVPRATWCLVIGPYLTRYEATTAGYAQFIPLYQDRDWLVVQGVWNWRL